MELLTMLSKLLGIKNNKVQKVMHEYKHGTLKSSSGSKVVNRKQAVAIALSEADRAAKMRKKGK